MNQPLHLLSEPRSHVSIHEVQATHDDNTDFELRINAETDNEADQHDLEQLNFLFRAAKARVEADMTDLEKTLEVKAAVAESLWGRQEGFVPEADYQPEEAKIRDLAVVSAVWGATVIYFGNEIAGKIGF